MRKLARRLSPGNWRNLPDWAFEWMYWNGGLHRVLQFEPVYDRHLLNKPRSKYGVKTPIVIYQMGKVASTAMQHSLTAMGLNVPIYQLHFMALDDDVLQWANDKRYKSNDRQLLLHRARYVSHAIRSREWKQVAMISMVRAPGPQLLSTFFQGLELNMPVYQELVERGELSPQRVADYFLEHFHPTFELQWFDRQLKEPFGIDVYATDFDKARGYQYYERDNIQLVVMRYEDLHRCVGEVMRDFLGIPEFTLTEANVGQAKKYGELYREVRRLLRIPPERIGELHATKYAQHFYTPEELAQSVARWT